MTTDAFTRTELLLVVFAILIRLPAGLDTNHVSGCTQTHGAEGLEATCSGLSRIPKDLPVGLRKLKVVNAEFTVLENGSFSHLPRLAVIDLSGNRLTHLQPESFRGLTHLKHLNLARNALCFGDDAFPAELFFNATSMRVLIMHSNSCPSGHVGYPDKALSGLINLEVLSMNGLPNVPLGSGFAAMKSLRSLELSGKYCNLDVVSNETFVSLRNTSVSQLSLRACNISKLDANAFTPLESLASLNLACNERIGIDGATLAIKGASTNSLDTLVLDDITVEPAVLDRRFFNSHRFKTVRRLSVRANDIVAFDVRALYLLPAVRRVATGFNSIYSVNGFYPREDNIAIIRNATASMQLEVVDASHFASPRAAYRRMFCDQDSVDFDHFFREKPSLKGVDYTRPTRPSPRKETRTTVIPTSVQVLFLDSAGSTSNHTTLPAVRITDYSDMVVLNISNTNRKVLKGPLTGLYNLQVLDVTNNQIYSVHSDAFRGLSRLKYLFLQHNLIGDVITDQFRGLHSLLELDLSFNRIPSIGRDAFQDLTHIRKLNIRGNRLTVLGFRVSNMASVESIDVSHNLAVYGNSDFLRGAALATNVHMNLANNSFVCNCTSAAFVRWVQTTSVHLTDKMNLQCGDDSDHTVAIAAIDYRQLITSCPVVAPSGGHYVGVTVGCLFLVAIVVLAVLAVRRYYRTRRGTGSKVAYRLYDSQLDM